MRILLALLAVSIPALAADPAPVPYPEGYRAWTHVKSMVIQPGHALFDAFGGVHHLYANPKALAGYRKGKFPDGAVIVFDLLEAQTG
ncbi:MAG: cytochrome P460 family protein, partial [Betaproteobacteria bacterium]|nr:cytochrome P460 family protein [Betaproteobacteria bacterium]